LRKKGVGDLLGQFCWGRGIGRVEDRKNTLNASTGGWLHITKKK